MTYEEAEIIAASWQKVVGKPMLNSQSHLDSRRISSLLIAPPSKMKFVFNEWWSNGNNNKRAVKHVTSVKGFEVYVMSYFPEEDSMIYYLRLSAYRSLKANNQPQSYLNTTTA